MMGIAGGIALLTCVGIEHEVVAERALVEVTLPLNLGRREVDHFELELALAQLQTSLHSAEPGVTAERALERSLRALGGATAGAIPSETSAFILRSFADDGWRLLALLRCYGGYAAGRELQPPAVAADPAAALHWLIGWQQQCFGQRWALTLFGHYGQQSAAPDGDGTGMKAWSHSAACHECLEFRDHVRSP